jgi:hypothetical protein
MAQGVCHLLARGLIILSFWHMVMFVRQPDIHTLSVLRGIYSTKNVIKSSERLEIYILSPTEEFPSNFWWNFFRYLTGTDPRYLDRYILSPTEEFTSFFGRISPLRRQFHKQKNFRQVFGWVSSTVWTEPIPDFSMVKPYPCHYAVRSTRPQIKRNLFIHQGRFYVTFYLMLKRI